MNETTNDMLTMFSAALTEIINKAVDKRVNEVLANMTTAKLMDSKLEMMINDKIVERIAEHENDNDHGSVDRAIEEALENLDLSEHVERTFKTEVNWEDYVDERVREQVEELVPSDDEIHDKIREVLNDVTFTVSVD